MIRREMGARLGADLSQVRFHSGADSIRRSAAMGARAWTQGRDVHFGRGGFEPTVAAHELVHTVQQGAVRGNVSQSMPMGAVQMKPSDEYYKRFMATKGTFAPDENEEPLAGDAADLTQVEAQAMRTFNSSRGNNVYNAIMPDIMDLLRKTCGGGKEKLSIKYSPKAAVSFMVRAAYQDYALRDILIELVNKPIGIFKTGVRTRQYQSLIKSISDRLGEYQAEELAMQAGLLAGEPKYRNVRRDLRGCLYPRQRRESGLHRHGKGI